MKRSVYFLLIFFPILLTAQTTDKKLDSLKNVKTNIQVQIRNLQVELQSVNKKIENLEQQKNQVPLNTIKGKVSSGGAILRDSPSSMGNSVSDIPGGASVIVYREQTNLYFKVSYNGKTGYVNYSTLEQNQEIDDFLSGKSPVVTNNSNQTIIRKVDESDPKYQKLVKLYGKEKAIRLVNGELWNGMSPGMVLESVGKPNSKQNQTGTTGNIEYWMYNDVTIQFQNGEVVNITKK